MRKHEIVSWGSVIREGARGRMGWFAVCCALCRPSLMLACLAPLPDCWPYSIDEHT